MARGRSGADGGRAGQLARAVELAPARVGGGRGHGRAFGFGPVRNAFNPARASTRGFGWLGDLLAAPAARWDAAWYLVIAHYGYRPDLGAFTSSRDRLLPAVPARPARALRSALPPVLAGVLISMVALALALYGIHRLTTLELAAARRRLGHAARRRAAGGARDGVRADGLLLLGRLLGVAVPGALGGALLVRPQRPLGVGRGARGAGRRPRAAPAWCCWLPALMLYLYGPREDRPVDPRSRAGRARAGCAPRATACGARTALVPAAALECAGCGSACAGGAALTGLPGARRRRRARAVSRPAGLGQALRRALSGGLGRRSRPPSRARASCCPSSARTSTSRSPGAARSSTAGHNLLLLAFLLAAVPAARGGAAQAAARLRRLRDRRARAAPLLPSAPQPLMSLPRFLVVLFPLSIWLAAWLAAHPRLRAAGAVRLGALMVFFAAQFATWHWVA